MEILVTIVFSFLKAVAAELLPEFGGRPAEASPAGTPVREDPASGRAAATSRIDAPRLHEPDDAIVPEPLDAPSGSRRRRPLSADAPELRVTLHRGGDGGVRAAITGEPSDGAVARDDATSAAQDPAGAAPAAASRRRAT